MFRNNLGVQVQAQWDLYHTAVYKNCVVSRLKTYCLSGVARTLADIALTYLSIPTNSWALIRCI